MLIYGFSNFRRGDDENQQAPLKNPLHVSIGSINRASSKEDEGIINLIQAIDRRNFLSNGVD